MLRISLVGDFSVRDQHGRDLTPRSAKGRGVVALLARTEGGRRSRRWIESVLWSDRGPEQASGSLRQALVDIRRSFRNSAELVESNRSEIALHRFETDVEADPDAVARALSEGRDFLEGFERRDPEFDRWLTNERRRLRDIVAAQGGGTAVPPGGPMPLILETAGAESSVARFVGHALASAIAQAVSEFAIVEVRKSNGGAVVEMPERGLALGVEVAPVGEGMMAMTGITDRRSHVDTWTRTARLDRVDDGFLAEGEVPSLVFEAAEAAIAALARAAETDHPADRANGMISQALDSIFRYDGAALRRADQLLGESHELWPTPVSLALRGLTRQIMLVERTEADRERLMSEADEFARLAVEDAARNPLVFAVASMVRIMLDADVVAGTVLSRDAIAFGPGNPYALAARAGVLLRAGKPEEAYELARDGARIVARSRFVHWWETLAGTAALAAHRYPQAVAHFETAHARAPRFRAPIRHLIFLYLQSSRPERARIMLDRLAAVEPDFSIGRIMEDSQYPAATLRQTKLLTTYGPALHDLK